MPAYRIVLNDEHMFDISADSKHDAREEAIRLLCLIGHQPQMLNDLTVDIGDPTCYLRLVR